MEPLSVIDELTSRLENGVEAVARRARWDFLFLLTSGEALNGLPWRCFYRNGAEVLVALNRDHLLETAREASEERWYPSHEEARVDALAMLSDMIADLILADGYIDSVPTLDTLVGELLPPG